MNTKRLERRGQDSRGGWALTVVLCVMVSLVTPFTPLLVGAFEIAVFDQNLAFEWLRTRGVEETITEFYRALGWPY
jgi:hypothetical protein